VYYGELVVIGYNGKLPTGNCGKLRSKFELKKRKIANSVKASVKYTIKAEVDKVILYYQSGVIDFVYCVRYGHFSAVTYEFDEDMDMYQIGRACDDFVDFQVLDTVPGAETALEQTALTHSTVSRYAARIVCSRHPPYRARLLAGAFDHNRNIILGNATCAQKISDNACDMDGFTRNGVLLLHPKNGFTAGSVPVWREISVCGKVYKIKDSRGVYESEQLRTEITNESNILTDGCLIDLCGVTLMWRSGYGKHEPPTKSVLDQVKLQISEMHDAQGSQPPPSLPTVSGSKPGEKTMMFVNTECGHIQGHYTWHADQNRKPLEERMKNCFHCKIVRPFVPVRFGLEPLIHQDFSSPTHVFSPCGHAIAEQTARYWANITIPHGSKSFKSICPFCGVSLCGYGFVRMIFVDDK
ncbi:uncharacterized protein TRIADDRAFT_27052, partial [Trichoplax adhaerens]